LEDVGVIVDSKEARKLFQNNGTEIDNKTKLVKIPENLIREQLKQVPDRFSLHGPDNKVKVEINTENVHFTT